MDYYDRLVHARDDLNVRKMLGNIDHEFIEDEIAQYLGNFNRSVRINNIFLKNILKLDVFYRQLSYEHITNRKDMTF